MAASDRAAEEARRHADSRERQAAIAREHASVLETERQALALAADLRKALVFESGSSSVPPAALPAVERLAEFLRAHAGREIAIEGFTDALGDEEANRRLSQSRAEAVKRALVERGVEADRIDARGYGPAFPVASNETPDGRQANRRVEIVINPS